MLNGGEFSSFALRIEHAASQIQFSSDLPLLAILPSIKSSSVAAIR
jgi:hypothetical protein